MSAIVSPITSHANKLSSHRTGWGRMWSECLNGKLFFREDWSNEDVVYFEHGMEFNEKSKGVNVFLKDPKSWDKLAEKARMFENFSGKLYSLDIDCPDYGARLKSRVREHSTNTYKNLDFAKITKVCKEATTLRQEDLDRDGIVFGDSHSLSAWRTDAYLSRNDGQTLNGAINRGFNTWTDKFEPKKRKLSFLRTYLGNIDIRHHICRLASDAKEQERLTLDLAFRYIEELKRWQSENNIQTIEVVASLPIENESRKLPKTGYFKGKPFWGSWAERNRVHLVFNQALQEACHKNSFIYVDWPDGFCNQEGELDFKFMEKPRSVHISPEHYMWKVK